ncbi:hypothetical protein [Promicromonospora sukumoe]
MSEHRIGGLDVARKYLFDAQDGLDKAARVLTTHGTAADGLKAVGRRASTLAAQVKGMKEKVRKVHEAAVAAERANGGDGRRGWGW